MTDIEAAITKALTNLLNDDFGATFAVRGNRVSKNDVQKAIAAIEVQGLAIVPVEPTYNMLEDAGCMTGYLEDVHSKGSDADHIEWWKAMIQAALQEGE